jgi:hypothetical protein
MAKVLACDVCGKTNPPGVLPPPVQPVCWKTAVEDYTGALCDECAATRTLAEIVKHLAGAPGGVVDGAERGPYLVIKE